MYSISFSRESLLPRERLVTRAAVKQSELLSTLIRTEQKRECIPNS